MHPTRLTVHLAPQRPPEADQHDACTEHDAHAVLQAVLDHLAGRGCLTTAELGEHLCAQPGPAHPDAHGMHLTWAELDDPATMRAYHANAHDRELQQARRLAHGQAPAES